MQFRKIEELRAFVSTLPPQFETTQTERYLPTNVSMRLPVASVDIAEHALKDAAASPDMNMPERPALASHIQSPAAPQTERERMVQSLAKEHLGKSRIELQGFLGMALGAEVADAMQSEAPTVQQAFGRHQRAVRAAKAEFGKDLTAAGVELKHHSEKDFMHVIVTQLDLLQTGVVPSVSAVVNAAFPDDPKKATSIKNSQHGKRRRKAWHSPAVINHPMEKAMQQTHGKESMNRRHSARTFGQSLGMNATLFNGCDRITKLEARVQLLEQQMQATKQREALADAGVTTPKEMVLSLYAKGIGPKMIANQLGMELERVRSMIYRSKRT